MDEHFKTDIAGHTFELDRIGADVRFSVDGKVKKLAECPGCITASYSFDDMRTVLVQVKKSLTRSAHM
jgi:hypothetical protein